MWNEFPLDLLAHVFSYLPPTSLARAMSTCTHWQACARSSSTPSHSHPPWLLAMPARGSIQCCYALDPSFQRWHCLPLRFIPHSIRPLGAVGLGLIICKLVSSVSSLRIALCNPFSKQFHLLPCLSKPRSNPAVGFITSGNSSSFRVFVAGGTSGACCYESTLEVYDSRDGDWRHAGTMPVEFAVRLTVWTPNESVHAGGTIYWMTSARAYSVVGFDVGSGSWREVRAPMADRLEWAVLVQTRDVERIGLVGGVCEGEACVWELVDGDEWELVGEVPVELGRRFWSRKGSWGATRCVGSDKALYLFSDLGSEMLVWRSEGKGSDQWEWVLVQGFSGNGEALIPKCNIPIRAVLLRPVLSS
ncbi:F-box only protein 6-like [Dioscorea cayenensis subsp. rotundata]|uniref:F-box only protein 6-like n=1 Tax=Dioscorea cayennensis subsp. rotundata TaxID=55577 RepID=A0AB40B5C5_DIOCR|nr:F-box only protein 6-like [Dioscorea cayenensis subsp. rotundata]